ncbi:MAG: tryptophan--tRNA ligase [bacterium]|nr:tryptophan--tRNA ligase [bacterium]
MSKLRVLSGMRPTGRLHLGHLLGALNNWKQFQDEYECFYMIADWHGLTTSYADTGQFQENIRQMLIDWLSCGVDRQKCVIFRQSQIPEHAELHILLSTIIPLPWLQRCPTYKDQLKELAQLDLHTYGFLGYPVLQAADILVYKANIVPVGEDQLPHLELTREICRRFNYLYGTVFPEPASKLTQTPKLPGVDGRKMSKSFGNCIYLSDSDDQIVKKVKSMITDPARIHPTDLGHPEVCVIFAFHQAFNKDGVEVVKQECQEAKRGCVKCKGELTQILISCLVPIHTARKKFEENPQEITNILNEGRETARHITSNVMHEVRQAMKIL